MNKSFDLFLVLLGLAIIVALSAFVLLGCTDEPGARRVLESMGFTDITITGWRWLSCGEEDGWRTGFRARLNGRQVSGVVCSGIFKGQTIRFD